MPWNKCRHYPALMTTMTGFNIFAKRGELLPGHLLFCRGMWFSGFCLSRGGNVPPFQWSIGKNGTLQFGDQIWEEWHVSFWQFHRFCQFCSLLHFCDQNRGKVLHILKDVWRPCFPHVDYQTMGWFCLFCPFYQKKFRCLAPTFSPKLARVCRHLCVHVSLTRGNSTDCSIIDVFRFFWDSQTWRVLGCQQVMIFPVVWKPQ